MERERRPIGYWLKRVDRLIEQAFERTLDADALTRRHWQVLNTLAAGRATRETLMQALRPFVEHDGSAVDVVIDDLLARGWLRNEQDGRLELSDQGRAAHAALATRVAATREILRRGITDHEYMTVVRVLERMASNLESIGA